MTKHAYHGWLIELIPQLEGTMWWCHYGISKTGEGNMQGASIELYASSSDAEAAALKKAQRLIDAYCEHTLPQEIGNWDAGTGVDGFGET